VEWQAEYRRKKLAPELRDPYDLLRVKRESETS
jgi:hypothetical protein